MLSRKKKAQALLQVNRMQEAKALYADICRSDPRDAEAWFLQGAVNGQLGLFEEAVDCCHRAIDIQPDHAEAYLNLGLAMQGLGRLEEAKNCFRTAVRLKPGFTTAMRCFKETARQTSGNKRLTVTIRGGIRLCVPYSLQLLTPYVLLEQEDWFEDEIGFVRRLLQSGAQVVDIGANYGAYTLTMATLAGSSGKVWAFEPASATASYLKESIRANGLDNIQLIQAALSNRRGTARLALNENSELNALGQTSDSGMGETVPLLTLDDCAQEYGWRDIEFIKLDAEGEEDNIVKGGGHFLSSQSPLIMFELQQAEVVNLPLIDRFISLGYAIYRLIPGLNMLAPFRSVESPHTYQLNLFCCKPDRAKQLEARGLLVTAPASVSAEAMQDDVWQGHLFNLPYARKVGQHWASSASSHFTQPGGEHYRNALNCYTQAHTKTTSPALHYGALMHSFVDLRMAIEVKATIARLQSFARVAWEAGYRDMAVQTLNRLANSGAEGEADAGEPFLPPSARFDVIEPAGNMVAWRQAAVLEQAVRLQGFSSYFSGIKMLKFLEALRSSEFRSAEMERRYQLIRLRHGMQDSPECNPLLASRTDDNLNPEFWCPSNGSSEE